MSASAASFVATADGSYPTRQPQNLGLYVLSAYDVAASNPAQPTQLGLCGSLLGPHRSDRAFVGRQPGKHGTQSLASLTPAPVSAVPERWG
jgi:hypothetical protein